MSTVQTFKRLISFWIALCTLLCLSACAEGTDSLNGIFSQLETSDSDTETQIPAFTEHIYIIIPNDCSGELSIKARELADKIKEKTEILTSLKYDSELTVIPKNACEILVGNTNRLASENAFDILRTDEYLCRWDDGAVVICGRNDASTIIAVDRFINEILPLSSKYSLMQSGAGFEFFCNYSVDSIKLNEYDLYDYVLTYAESNKGEEKAIAFMLRDFINSKSGYLLDVIADSELKSKNCRFISLLGSSDENVLTVNEKGISLQGTDSYMLSLAVAKFIKDFEANTKDNAVELNYYEKTEIEAVNALFQASVCFVKENKEEPFRPIYNLLVLLQSENMGLCFIGNPNDVMREDLAINLRKHIKLHELLIGERELIVAYSEKNVKQINIEVDESQSYVKVDVETYYGEQLSFIYIINHIINGENISENKLIEDLLKRNSVVLGEAFIDTESEEIPTLQSGNFKLEDVEKGYFYAHGENVYIQNPQQTVNDSQNEFSCVINNKMIYSNEFLNIS